MRFHAGSWVVIILPDLDHSYSLHRHFPAAHVLRLLKNALIMVARANGTDTRMLPAQYVWRVLTEQKLQMVFRGASMLPDADVGTCTSMH